MGDENEVEERDKKIDEEEKYQNKKVGSLKVKQQSLDKERHLSKFTSFFMKLKDEGIQRNSWKQPIFLKINTKGAWNEDFEHDDAFGFVDIMCGIYKS